MNRVGTSNSGLLENLGKATQVRGLGHYLWDVVADKCIQCSEEHAAIHGMSVADYIAQSSTVSSLAHPEDADMVRAAFDQLRNGQTFTIEYRIIQPDGRVKFIREIGHPIFDNDGRVVQEIGTSQDITRQRQMAVTLQENERRYRDLFEQSPVPFMEEDWSLIRAELPPGRFADRSALRAYLRADLGALARLYDCCQPIQISSNFAKLYKAGSVEEFRPHLNHQAADPEEIEGFARALEEFYFDGSVYSYEANETAVDGSSIVTRVKFYLPPGYGDNWRRVLVSVEDITKEAALQQALQKSQHFEAIGQLSGGIAHDFNNLLAVIRGAVELMPGTEAETSELLDEIRSATERGAELTRHLLSYAGKQPIAPRPLDVGELIDGMRPLLRSTLGVRVPLHISNQSDGWSTLADPGQIKDAIINLAINARDAMPADGELRIRVAHRALSTAEQRQFGVNAADVIVIEVSDAGSGMDPETLDQAFDPFFTTKGHGTGLGLPSVFGFAKQAGGLAQIESTPGQGTTVSILLPASASRAEAQTEDQRAAPIPKGRGERVLIVDDSADVRHMVARQLTFLGYHVTTSEDAHDATNLLRKSAIFDLILSDIVMPRAYSGATFASDLKAADPDQKILLMSGYPPGKEMDKVAAFPDIRMLQKPFTIGELAEAVAQALGLRTP